MEFFRVVEIADCPTTSLNVVGRYLRADTINLSIGVAKIARLNQKSILIFKAFLAYY
jgi:hypothetical protein